MEPYLEIKCLICGHESHVSGNQVERPEYRCEHCGMRMAKSLWGKSKVSYFVASELLRLASAALGDSEAATEVCAFHVVCKGAGGIPITFSTDYRVNITPYQEGE